MLGKTKWIACASALVLIGCQSATKVAHSEDVCENTEVVSAAKPAQPAAPKKVATFGAEQKLTDADAVPVAKVLAEPAAYNDKYVRVTGKVTQVCAKKGCWLRVAPAEGSTAAAGDIFIKFRDPPAGRLIPMEAIGQNVTVEGTVKTGMMSERAARHFKEDGGASEEEVNKIVGPQKQMTITGAAVAIEGVEKPS
jgi:hypothetical protein